MKFLNKRSRAVISILVIFLVIFSMASFTVSARSGVPVVGAEYDVAGVPVVGAEFDVCGVPVVGAEYD